MYAYRIFIANAILSVDSRYTDVACVTTAPDLQVSLDIEVKR